MSSPLHPSPTHCNHSSILSQTSAGIPLPSIPTVHPRATHCFIAQCCSLKDWNSAASRAKIKPDMWGSEGGVWRRICTTTRSLVLELVYSIKNIDGYGPWDCTFLNHEIYHAVIVWMSCSLVGFFSISGLFLIHAYKVINKERESRSAGGKGGCARVCMKGGEGWVVCACQAPCWASIHWSWSFTRDPAWQSWANLPW